jgi:hypothetical protein
MRVFLLIAGCCIWVLGKAQTSLPVSFHFAASATHKMVLINLTGKITDSLTGQPLPGASIYFAEARIGAIANADGRYIFKEYSYRSPFN